MTRCRCLHDGSTLADITLLLAGVDPCTWARLILSQASLVCEGIPFQGTVNGEETYWVKSCWPGILLLREVVASWKPRDDIAAHDSHSLLELLPLVVSFLFLLFSYHSCWRKTTLDKLITWANFYLINIFSIFPGIAPSQVLHIFLHGLTKNVTMG